LRSNNNRDRGEAESLFNQSLSNDIRGTLNELLQVVLVSNDEGLKEFGAVLFRGQLVRKKAGQQWWSLLSEAERGELRNVLLQRLANCTKLSLGRQLVQIVAQISRLSWDEQMTVDQWPSLLGDLATLASSQENKFAPVLAVATLDEIVQACPQKVENGDTPMKMAELLCNVMNSGSSSVRVEAVKAMSSLLSLVDETDASAFTSVLSSILNVFEVCLHEEELVLKWFEAVIEIINNQPKMLVASGHPESMVTVMLRVASDAQFSEDVRKQSLEVCSTVAVELPLMYKNNVALTTQMLQVTILFMLEPSDEDEEDHVEGIAEDESMCDRGERALYFAVECLGAAMTLPLLFPMIDELLKHTDDWRKQRAGIVAIMMAAHNGGKIMYDALAPVLQRIIPSIVKEQENIKVRKTGLDTLSTIFIVYGDVDTLLDDMDGEEDIHYNPDEEDKKNVQHLFSKELLTALAMVLEPPNSNDPSIWSFKAKAANAVANFCAGVDDGWGAEILGEFGSMLLDKLLRLITLSTVMQQSPQNRVDVTDVQGAVLAAIGAMAKALGEDFGQYYDTFMPIAKQSYMLQEHLVLQGKNMDKKDKASWLEKQVLLRGQAMECITNIGQAVGAEKFKQDAGPLMEIVIGYMENNWNKGDSDRNRQVADLASNICICMGVEEMNEQILGKLIPPFITWAKNPVHHVLNETEFQNLQENQDEEDEEEDQNDGKLFHMTENGEVVCINTFQMKEKECAVRILAELVDEIGTALMPWAGHIASLMIQEIMSEISTPELELCATFTMGKLVDAVSKYMRTQNNAPEQREFAQRMFTESLEACLNSLAQGFEDAVEEDQERLDDLDMGKEADEEDDQGALVMVTTAEQITAILRAAYESSGRSDKNVDLFCNSNYNPSALMPLFCLHDDLVGKIISDICACMSASCERPRGKPWWKDSHNNDVMDALSEAIGILLKTHGERCLESFAQCALPLGEKLLLAKQGKKGKGVTASLKSVGLFFFDDAIEYGGPQASAFVPMAVKYMLENAKNPNVFLRQAAVYGLGVCAQRGGGQFTPFVEQTVTTLIQVIEHPNARKGNNGSATDNAISALLKCILYRQVTQLVPKLLGYLPCNSDVLEARVIHYLLYKAVAEKHPAFMEFGARLKDIFAAAAVDKSGYSAKNSKFEEESSVLTNETRQWIQSNI